jgi:Flp pilus assembly protein TadD
VLALGRAAERHPDDPGVYTALGRVWLDDGEVRGDRVAVHKAIEALEPIASRESASGETLALYGRALFLNGEITAAQRVLALATTKLPVEPATYLYLSAASERLRHADAARRALLSYVALTRTSALDAEVRVSELADRRP